MDSLQSKNKNRQIIENNSKILGKKILELIQVNFIYYTYLLVMNKWHHFLHLCVYF